MFEMFSTARKVPVQAPRNDASFSVMPSPVADKSPIIRAVRE